MFKLFLCSTKYKKNINAMNEVRLTVCKCAGKYTL